MDWHRSYVKMAPSGISRRQFGFAMCSVLFATSSRALPSLAVLERKWSKSLVWIVPQRDPAEKTGRKASSISRRHEERHQGFFISNKGWILAHHPRSNTGDRVIIERFDGQRRRGTVVHTGLDGLVLVQERQLSFDGYSPAIPLASEYLPCRNRWLYGVAFHADKGHPLAAMGGLSAQQNLVGYEKKMASKLLLDLPLWPGTPIFFNEELVAVGVQKTTRQELLTIDVKRLRTWLALYSNDVTAPAPPKARP
ncbi:MAG: hypothetical protein GY822_14050 [Deltaproteobacteria bacterium]|nr:hypothetical protein [Deltaproteobacteria bacterium]